MFQFKEHVCTTSELKITFVSLYNIKFWYTIQFKELTANIKIYCLCFLEMCCIFEIFNLKATLKYEINQMKIYCFKFVFSNRYVA